MNLFLSDIGIKPVPLFKHNPFLTPPPAAKKEEPIIIEHIDYRKQ